jgi:hypothetical protein
MPRLEIVTMSNHELSFTVPYLFYSMKGLSGNTLLWLLMVTFGNQSPNNYLLKRVI